MKRYRHRPKPHVEAMLYDGTNGEEIAAWLGGTYHRKNPAPRNNFEDEPASIRVDMGSFQGMGYFRRIPLFPDYWVVKDGAAIEPWPDKQFREEFEPTR